MIFPDAENVPLALLEVVLAVEVRLFEEVAVVFLLPIPVFDMPAVLVPVSALEELIDGLLVDLLAFPVDDAPKYVLCANADPKPADNKPAIRTVAIVMFSLFIACGA